MTGFATGATRLGFVVMLAVLAAVTQAGAQQQNGNSASSATPMSSTPSAITPGPAPVVAPQSLTTTSPASDAAATAAPAFGETSASPAPVGASQQFPPASSPTSDSTEAGALPARSVSASAPSVASASPSTLPQDLSPWGMLMQADVVVKAVMIGLAFASLVTWTIWLARGLELAATRRRAQSCVRKLMRADSLGAARAAIAEGWTGKGPVAELMAAAERECSRSNDLSAEGIKERLAIALSRIEAKAGRDIARGTGLLATIGATAPFVGLFGTVWGIMNAFIGISHSRTTNLAVVAPGIAEALLATALGLVAAIPAVIIYNVFARALASYRALLSDASGEIVQHISRDLERQARGLVSSVVPLSRARPAAE
ncbi:tonB-system energizer ExbB [Nitrobacter sp.]|uniref:tonB-system energizer ExbB n=1 Tax=Nitrobacter sp. TaxID=29420 RepID=UPI00399D60D2